MLFNSYAFIFWFLPIIAGIYLFLRSYLSVSSARYWLIVASLAYYDYPRYQFTGILIISFLFNHFFVKQILKKPESKLALGAGVAFNLGLLCFFKYANFFGMHWMFPIGLSFYTFQQLAFLLDAKNRLFSEVSFVTHLQFISFFPYIVCGPIARYRETAPQLKSGGERGLPLVGVTLFFMGLFKKLILADPIGSVADQMFAQLESGIALGAMQAWVGAFSYALQLYFDFSGYSEMAIGVAALFGIRLPINFDSPYKANTLMDLWRRWHMTLTGLIMSFVFTPLATAIARKTMRWKLKPKSPIMTGLTIGIPAIITFVLVGAWHGEKWTYIVFGITQGIWFTLNSRFPKFKNRGVTFIGFTLTLVIFRSANLAAAGKYFSALLMSNGLVSSVLIGSETFFRLFVLAAIVFYAPNVRQMLGPYYPALPDQVLSEKEWAVLPLRWRPVGVGILFSVLITLAAILALGDPRSFLYFQF